MTVTIDGQTGQVVVTGAPTTNGELGYASSKVQVMEGGVAKNVTDAGAGVPTGTIVGYAGTSEPTGWLWAAGQSVSKTTYAALLAVCGTGWGASDGSSFTIPDLRGRIPFGYEGTSSRLTSPIAGGTMGSAGGAETVTLAEAEIPQHGTLVSNQHTITTGGGSGGDVIMSVPYPQSVASGSAGSSGSHSNQPPTYVLNYIIKT